MSEVLKMLDLPTLPGLTSVISLPGLVDGPLLLPLPSGLPTDPSGPVPAPVNHLVLPGKVTGLPISVIYGQHGSVLLSSADLQLSLESRLRHRLALDGSTVYRLIWKHRVTPLGRRICALRASAHPISDNASGLSGWATPNVTFQDGDPQKHLERKVRAGVSKNPVITDLSMQVGAWSNGPARLTTRGEILTGSSAGMSGGGKLNPEHSRWLMGYPVEWGCCGDTAMQSSRKPRRNS